MRWLVPILAIATFATGSAMAKPKDVDAKPRPERNAARPADTDARKEQEDADLDRLLEKVYDGKLSMDEAVKQFRAKWYGGKPVPDKLDPEPAPPSMRDEQRALGWK
jgi:hypothetical protein